MTSKNKQGVASLHINSRKNTNLKDLLDAQYGHLEKGELRALLETTHARVWSPEELEKEFIVHAHDESVARVTNKLTKQAGTLIYIDAPRLYFDFEETNNGE